jgi:hypothetical protein
MLAALRTVIFTHAEREPAYKNEGLLLLNRLDTPTLDQEKETKEYVQENLRAH